MLIELFPAPRTQAPSIVGVDGPARWGRNRPSKAHLDGRWGLMGLDEHSSKADDWRGCTEQVWMTEKPLSLQIGRGRVL